jgi:hypothetical protein
VHSATNQLTQVGRTPFTSKDDAESDFQVTNGALHERFGYSNSAGIPANIAPPTVTEYNSLLEVIRRHDKYDTLFLLQRWKEKLEVAMANNNPIIGTASVVESTTATIDVAMANNNPIIGTPSVGEAIAATVLTGAKRTQGAEDDDDDDEDEDEEHGDNIVDLTKDKSMAQPMPSSFLPVEWWACVINGLVSNNPEASYQPDTQAAEAAADKREKILEANGLTTDSAGGTYSRQRQKQMEVERLQVSSYVAGLSRNERRGSRRTNGEAGVSDDEELTVPSSNGKGNREELEKRKMAMMVTSNANAVLLQNTIKDLVRDNYMFNLRTEKLRAADAKVANAREMFLLDKTDVDNLAKYKTAMQERTVCIETVEQMAKAAEDDRATN